MTDLGNLSVSWRRNKRGQLLVTCRELPEFSATIDNDSDALGSMQRALTAHLAQRYGIAAALQAETDTVHFRCCAPS